MLFKRKFNEGEKVGETFTYCLPSPILTTSSRNVTANTVLLLQVDLHIGTAFFSQKAKLSKQVCLLHTLVC